MKKKQKKKKQFLLKSYPGSDLYDFIFARFSLFSKVILLICSNITMLYITVAEIWPII